MSKTIAANMRVSILADEDYWYEIFTGDSMGLRYEECFSKEPIELRFASLEEMEVVAKTMLKIVKATREISE
jgi:hypothetical protein